LTLSTIETEPVLEREGNITRVRYGAGLTLASEVKFQESEALAQGHGNRLESEHPERVQ
jgi:hypothetical protein